MRAGMIATTFVAGFLTLAACEQGNGDQRGMSRTSLSDGERDFMIKAAHANQAEIRAGEVALQRASNDEVKQFGRRMIDDHTNAYTQLQAIANEKRITLPIEADQDARQKLDQISKLTGAEFDRKFMDMMVSDHEKAISLFEKEAKDVKDSALRDYVQNTLPTLRDHLSRAREIRKSLGEPSAH